MKTKAKANDDDDKQLCQIEGDEVLNRAGKFTQRNNVKSVRVKSKTVVCTAKNGRDRKMGFTQSLNKTKLTTET